MVEHANLVLQRRDMALHLFVFVRVLEAIAAIWRVNTFEIQIATTLARGLPITLDLPPLAFIARD